MKKFKYEFTRTIKILIVAGLVLCVLGFGINMYQVLRFKASESASPVYTYIQYALMFFVTVALFAILLSLLLSSYYSVDKENILTCFGFIKSKYKIAEVDLLELDRKTNKLSVYFKNEQFIVIVVKEQWYNDFINAVLEVNPKIEYSIVSDTDKKDEEK